MVKYVLANIVSGFRLNLVTQVIIRDEQGLLEEQLNS